MALRYLAVHSKRPLRCDQRVEIEGQTGLRWIGTAGPADIFVSAPDDCIFLPGMGGFIVGHLFEKDGAFNRVTNADPSSVSSLAEPRIPTLLNKFWGGYVAFLTSPDAQDLMVLRDPSGLLPCYYVDQGDAVAFSSDIETLATAGYLDAAVDWDGLGYHLFSQDLRTTQTALKGVRDILPGFQAHFSSKVVVNCAWSPWNHVTPLPNLPDPAAQLEETIDGCVRAWASAFTNILAPVSGGLDSSIIAASLARQTTPWICLNMATDESEGDERYYARILAGAFGHRLSEAFHTLSDVDITRSGSIHLPRPHAYAFGQSEEMFTRRLMTRNGIDATFTGHGGDNIFCFLQSATPLVDRYLVEGAGIGAWQTLNDICTLTGASLFEVMGMGFGRLVRFDPSYDWEGDTSFLTAGAYSATRLSHPWLKAPKGALPGKAVHIAALLRIQSSLESASRLDTGPLIAPFLSQPIVELCLSIPTWKWCEGGINRAVARRAFRDRLPAELIGRRWKGGPNSFCLDVLAAHHQAFKSFLLDGLLVKHEVLDASALNKLYDRHDVIGPPHHLRIGALAEAEAWARHWDK